MFEQNREAAIAGASVSTFIAESGEYKGTFENVAIYTANSGAEALHFDFVSEGGERASFQIYYKNKKGETIDMGQNKIIALNATMKVKAATTQEERSVCIFGNEVSRTCLVDMEGQRVGVVFQRELSTGQDGKTYDNVRYVTSFNCDTGRTADEIYGDKPAKRKDKVVAGLKEVIDKTTAPGGFTESEMRPPEAQISGGSGYGGFDDDVPF